MSYRFKKQLKNLHTPRPEFLRAGEDAFLRWFDARVVSQVPRYHRVLGYKTRYALGVVGILVLFTGGGAVYADAQNVGPAHVLYPLKRAQESVRVALTPRARESMVHTQLAKRRVQEALELQEQDHQNRAQELMRDARASIRTALETSESTENENEACAVMHELSTRTTLALSSASGIEAERCNGVDAD
ncbi:MAG: DUF5667 domain-containing protein [Patescibacteria group bacterium]|nr:DUF5667 domain-containing protein [Patescibacteria group bacterium]